MNSPNENSRTNSGLFFWVKALILGLFALSILHALNHPAQAGIETNRFVCAARIDCGSPALPSTQDLPADVTPTVRSTDAETAKATCLERYSASYARLEKTLAATRECKVGSEVFKQSARRLPAAE